MNKTELSNNQLTKILECLSEIPNASSLKCKSVDLIWELEELQNKTQKENKMTGKQQLARNTFNEYQKVLTSLYDSNPLMSSDEILISCEGITECVILRIMDLLEIFDDDSGHNFEIVLDEVQNLYGDFDKLLHL